MTKWEKAIEVELFLDVAQYLPVNEKGAYVVQVGRRVLRHVDRHELFKLWLKARTAKKSV